MDVNRFNQLVIAIRTKTVHDQLAWDEASWSSDCFVASVGTYGVNIRIRETRRGNFEFGITNERGETIETVSSADNPYLAPFIEETFHHVRRKIKRVGDVVDELLKELGEGSLDSTPPPSPA